MSSHIPDVPGTDKVRIPGTYTPPPLAAPPPAVAAPQLASIGQRVGAYFLEGAIVGVLILAVYLVGVILALTVSQLVGAIVLTIGTIVVLGLDLWLVATKGYNFGKYALGLRVVDQSSGALIGWGRTLLRQLVLSLVSTFTLGVGLIVSALTAGNDPRRQAWHDKAARSVVVQGGDAGMNRPSPAAPPVSQPSPVDVSPVSPLPPPRPAAAAPPVPPRSVTPPAGSSAVAAPPRAAQPTPSVVPPPPGGVVAPPPFSVPAPPVAAPVDRPPTSVVPVPDVAGWSLALDDGTSRDLVGVVLVGRDPSDDSGTESVSTWAVHDPDKSLSKTHAAFGTDGAGGAWVEDRHSTNGVVVVGATGTRELAPGERTSVDAGDRVELGERVVVVRSVAGE